MRFHIRDLNDMLSFLLVLLFSVVANGSSLAYAKNAGASLSTLRYIRGTQGRDDARAQRLETTESIRIRLFGVSDVMSLMSLTRYLSSFIPNSLSVPR
ncbi:MAG: hypothetical protein C5S47_03855 [Candidatus Methanogasteraceae archaeon]|nr:MAG: hypothetical protein C5S47_03855 [ANME-2 cluster archaeon]